MSVQIWYRLRASGLAIGAVGLVACASYTAHLQPTRWPSERNRFTCPLEIVDSLSGARLTLRNEHLIGESVGNDPPIPVESYADYDVEPGDALGVGPDQLLRVDCVTYRIRGRVSAPREVRQNPREAEHCHMDAYLRRFDPEGRFDVMVHADSLDTPLRRLGGPNLVYPPRLRDAGYGGWVVVAYQVQPSGRTAHARVMASSRRDFEESVLQLIAGSYHTRPVKNGRPAAAFRCHAVAFSVRQ